MKTYPTAPTLFSKLRVRLNLKNYFSHEGTKGFFRVSLCLFVVHIFDPYSNSLQAQPTDGLTDQHASSFQHDRV